MLSFISGNLIKSSALYLVSRLQVYRTRTIRVHKHPKDRLDYILNFFVRQPLLLTQHLLADESLLDVGVVDRSTELE